MIRPLEEQLEYEKVKQFRLLIEAFRELDIPNGPGTYFRYEIIHSLEAGLLLAAIELSASLLELVVRDLVAKLREKKYGLLQKYGSYFSALKRRLDLENDRTMMFLQLLKELESNAIITSENADPVRKFYKYVRIPLHHGLTGRYISKSLQSPSDDLFAVMFTASHSFEESIEQRAFEELSCVVNFIGAYGCK